MDSKSNIYAIFKRELLCYFSSPVAYVFIVIFLMLLGFFTFSVSRFYEIGQSNLSVFFEWFPWIFLFFIPAITMKLWSEEKRQGTIELILTLPITLTDVIIGKFLAAWIFMGIALLLTFPMVISVLYLGSPDMGVIFSAYFATFLLAGAFISVGLMTSSFTQNQVVSFILAIAISLFLILSGFPPVLNFLYGWAPAWTIKFISSLSFMTHFHSMVIGVLDFRDILYFVSVIFFMLYANGAILQNRRTS